MESEAEVSLSGISATIRRAEVRLHPVITWPPLGLPLAHCTHCPHAAAGRTEAEARAALEAHWVGEHAAALWLTAQTEVRA